MVTYLDWPIFGNQNLKVFICNIWCLTLDQNFTFEFLIKICQFNIFNFQLFTCWLLHLEDIFKFFRLQTYFLDLLLKLNFSRFCNNLWFHGFIEPRALSLNEPWPDFEARVVITLCFFFILLTLSSSFDCRRLIARNSEISFSSFEFLSICFLALSWLFSSSLIRLSFCSSCFKTLSSVLVWTLLSFTWIGQAWISRFFWTTKKVF